MKKTKNPEAQMPLQDHLRELRKRLVISVCAMLVGSVVGWFLYDPVVSALQEPLQSLREDSGRQAHINFDAISSSFDMKLRISVFIGFIIASPVWIYEVWAFIVPGLKKKEKRVSIAFLCAAVPLFLAGICVGWSLLPNLVRALTSFTPEGASNIISAQTYFDFVMRLLMLCGLAFLFPVIIVGLDMAHVFTAKQIAKSWRVSVILILVFGAIAAPGPDVMTMFYLAIPMLFLYFLAVGVCFVLDHFRQKRVKKKKSELRVNEPTSYETVQRLGQDH